MKIKLYKEPKFTPESPECYWHDWFAIWPVFARNSLGVELTWLETVKRKYYLEDDMWLYKIKALNE